jgi:hypothetical protein
VQLGEHDLDGRLVLLGVHVDRDAAAVVDDAHPAVGEESNLDLGGVAGHRLVDGVVNDLPHAVVETGRTGAADVHAGALPNGVEPFQHLHAVGPVRAGCLRHESMSFSEWARRRRATG